MMAKAARFLPLALLLLAACHNSGKAPDAPQETLTEAENVSRSVNDIEAAQEAAAPPVEEAATAPLRQAAPPADDTAAATDDEGEAEVLPDEEESDEAD